MTTSRPRRLKNKPIEKEEASPDRPFTFRKWIEPWYASYALLGISVAGVIPILLPLAVSMRGSIADVGFVVAALNVGGLSSPLWGILADRHRLHRLILLSGLLVTAATIAAIPFATSLSVEIILAALQGCGAAAVATVANLFIVEVHPESEWDKRLGWLQTFYGGGQVVGLILAGYLARVEIHAGFLTTAGATAFALIPAWFAARTPTRTFVVRPVVAHPPRHAEVQTGSPQRHYHYPTREALRNFLHSITSPFGLFLVAWLVSFMGPAAFFSLYPVLMRQAFGVTPPVASCGFAVSAALGLTLYPFAGKWSDAFGAMRVLQIGLAVRLIAFIGFLIIGAVESGSHTSLALIDFLFVVLAWSLLSVAGTAMTSQFARSKEGEGLGLYNAATAFAGVAGAALGGWIADRLGYQAVSLFGFIAVSIGLIIITLIPKQHSIETVAS